MINLYDYRINIKTAGPSYHDNVRSELYFAGCQKALDGDSCVGCFNHELWYPDRGTNVTPENVLERLECMNSVKSITIVGGEPTDQLEGLVELSRLLKEHGYHIIVITWKDYETLTGALYEEMFKHIDILVDGMYDQHQRIYDDTHTNVLRSFIGSNNQRIIDLSSYPHINVYNNINQHEDIYITENGGVAFV